MADHTVTKTLHEAAASHSLVPLWDIYHRLTVKEPQPGCAAAIWHYEDVRPVLMRAGREISTDEAERRVLLFKNPDVAGPFATHTIGCGLQLLLEGEVEGAHRHSQAALRFAIEGTGAYTTTDGERIWMEPGDVITTPSWTWHDHGKTTAGPMVWLDAIDVPLINHLKLNFSEFAEGAARQQALRVADNDSSYRYGSGLRPLDGLPTGPYSPVYTYPYARTREVLDKMRRDERWDPSYGIKLRFANPLTGGDFMPTLAGFMQLLPAGFNGTRYRSTDATIYCVAEGHGRVLVNDQQFLFAPHDVFVVPNWTWHRFETSQEAILFSVSDRAMQDRLALWREDREV